jgi:hypothetical protein
VYVGECLSLGLHGKVLQESCCCQPDSLCAIAHKTREIRPPGIAGGLTETWVMGVGLRPTGKPVDEPPDPKAVRAVSLSRLRGRSGNWPFYLDSLERLKSRLKSSPLSLPKPNFPRPSPRGTLESPSYLILSCMSKPRVAALHLAASRCGGLPRLAGGAAIAAGEGWPPGGGALACPKGVFRGCAPEVPALKCCLNILYVGRRGPSREWSLLHLGAATG